MAMDAVLQLKCQEVFEFLLPSDRNSFSAVQRDIRRLVLPNVKKLTGVA